MINLIAIDKVPTIVTIWIGQYVNICNLYIRTKLFQHLSIRELYSLPVSDAKWKTISIDFIVKSIGFDVVITTVDLVFKIAHFILTYTMVSIKKVARLFSYYV